MALIDDAKRRIEDARERWPLLDHLVRTVEHFGNVNGSALAAAVTYFAFLSFFPIIALAFAVIGFVSGAYPNAERDLVTAINDVLPGIVGDGEGELSLDTLQKSRPGHPERRPARRPLLRPRLALRHAHRPHRGLRGAGEGAAQLRLGQAPRHPRAGDAGHRAAAQRGASRGSRPSWRRRSSSSSASAPAWSPSSG